MNEVLLEAVKQAPQLAVLAWVVWRFLHVISAITNRHEEATARFAEIADRSAYVIGQNTEILRRINGYAVDDRPVPSLP